MQKRGLGALEMLAMELKAAGTYVSRGLSWEGAEFATVEMELPEDALVMYNDATEFWKLVRLHLTKAIDMCGAQVGACF
jgi:hypothetical protein